MVTLHGGPVVLRPVTGDTLLECSLDICYLCELNWQILHLNVSQKIYTWRHYKSVQEDRKLC